MRKLCSVFTMAFFITAITALLPMSAAAQDADPPGRVARLNYIQGSVSYQVPGDNAWVDADPNRPLTAGDNLWVDDNSRGELHIGSTAIRLSSQTGISFLNLDDEGVQLQLAQGVIEVHLRYLPSGDAFEIDTPNLSFTPDRPGDYRIEADPNGDSTVIIVRQGQGEVIGDGGRSWPVRAGREYVFNGTDRISYDSMGAPRYDDFDNWSISRNQREENSRSARYVSREVDGYYDLDQYGDWDSDPDYGNVWFPRGVESSWAPYQVGHWVYLSPWGWTWVDEEPWGYAPSHYGRWVYARNRWGWVPGPVAVRPVYAPALVAFVGGGGFGLSISFGNSFSGVAWYPLGPRDVYVPSYRCSPRYVQNVNITNTRVVNVTQVTNVYITVVINHDVTRVNYTYAHNNTAVTAVSRDTFVGARSVRGASVRVTTDQINQAHVVDSAPIAPTRTSYVSASAKVSNNRPAVPFTERHVVEQRTPKARDNREGEAPNNQNNNGRPFGQQQPNQSGNQQGTQRGNSNVQPNAAPPAANDNRNGQPNNGYRPFGQQRGNQQAAPGNGNNSVQPSAPQPSGNDNRNGQPNNGYRPFGRPQGNQQAAPGSGNNNVQPTPQAPSAVQPSAPQPGVNDNRNNQPNNGNRPFGRQQPNQQPNQPPAQQVPPTPSTVQPSTAQPGGNDNRNGQPNNGNRPFGRQQPNQQPTQQAQPDNVKPSAPDTRGNPNNNGQRAPRDQGRNAQPPAQNNNDNPNSNGGRGNMSNRPVQNPAPAVQPPNQAPPAQVQKGAPPPQQETRGKAPQKQQGKQQDANSKKQEDKKQNDKNNEQ